MAKTQIVHSSQATTLLVKGDKNNPEPIHQIDDAEHITQLALKVKGTYQTTETL